MRCDLLPTNNELALIISRDNMKSELSQIFSEAAQLAIVDEVDSILIDEARRH